jgi:histidine triad (HIT) family protein
MASTCVFCEIVAGTAPAKVVATWPDAIALVPLTPVVDGHTIVIPRRHVPDLAADPDVAAAVMRRTAEIATPPCNIITSAGSAATQTVFHLHLHIVPRTPGDGLALPWAS